MKQDNQPHILNAASNLLGICLVLVTGLKVAKADIGTMADEITLGAAMGFLGSCVLSYISIRGERNTSRYERIADILFLVSLAALSVAILIFALDLH